MQYSIVKMKIEHLDSVAALEKECFKRAWSKDALSDEIDNPNAHFLVAQSKDGYVLGYIGCIFVCSEGSITNLAVSKTYRRQKIGSDLIKRLSSDAKKLNADALFLEVRQSNSAAISLYEKQGFEKIAVRKSFYREPLEDAFVMKLCVK